VEFITQLQQSIDGKKSEYIELADSIWALAEMRYQEHRSAELHISMLEKHGFRITRNLAGMPTAFVAEAGTGGPILGLLGEYDALAGLSQESGGIACRPSTEIDNGNGHGCGHHLLGTAAHLAAVAAKEHLEASGRPGTIRFYGCPAEEAGAGKTFMAREGYFDDLDAALSWHPGVVNSIFDTGTLANIQAYFKFHGKSAHAAASPHLGRSALDAAELMNVGVNYMREHMPSQARIHFAYINSGGVSPNVVPAEAEVLYTVRATRNDEAIALFERVRKIAEGAALMTGTTFDMVFDRAVSNLMPNLTLNQVMYENMLRIGTPKISSDENQWAKSFQETLSSDELENSGRMLGVALRDPRPVMDGMRPYVPAEPGPAVASTDVGDVSWVTPTAQCLTACYAWGTGFHSWQMVAQGKLSLAHKGMLLAAKILAATAVDLYGKPEVLKAARSELDERRHHKPYVCPIPADVVPPTLRKL
jgi:aminobenzoyl-glutamate utilization protein B